MTRYQLLLPYIFIERRTKKVCKKKRGDCLMDAGFCESG